MTHEFVLVDVFTDRAFTGNQLAVFPHATGLSDETMQALAREFNFSEITFVLPSDRAGCDFRVRIFDPVSEMPFAGHPTVGTAAVLVAGGHAQPGRLVLEERIGPVTVDVEGASARLTLTPSLDLPSDPPQRESVAAALSLPESDVVDCWYAGVGVPFCYVHVAAGAVDRAELDRAGWTASGVDRWSDTLYAFEGDPVDGGRLYARALIPSLGTGEDPATGSAVAALVASLARRAPLPDGTHRLTVDQGVLMGRPSVIEASVDVGEGQPVGVSVGGSTVIVGHGALAR